MTTSSDGPAGPSIPTSPALATIRFAASTYTLPGPDDHVDGRDRFGAVGHRRDGLGATDAVDLVDTRQQRRGQGDRRDASVRRRGNAQDPFRHAGHERRDRGHQHRRRVGRAPAGDVQAGPVDRPHRLGHAHPRVGEGRGRLLDLALVVPADTRRRQLQSGEHGPIGGLDRGLALGAGHSQRVDHDAVEPGGQVAESGIAALTDVAEDRGDRLDHVRVVVGPASAAESQPVRGITVRVAEIEPGQHRRMVPGISRTSREVCIRPTRRSGSAP